MNDSNKIINEKVTEVLKKFENSSSKGIMSENITYNLDDIEINRKRHQLLAGKKNVLIQF